MDADLLEGAGCERAEMDPVRGMTTVRRVRKDIVNGERAAVADPRRPAFVVSRGGRVGMTTVDEQHAERLVPELRHGRRPAHNPDHALLKSAPRDRGPEPPPPRDQPPSPIAQVG